MVKILNPVQRVVPRIPPEPQSKGNCPFDSREAI